MTKSRPDVKKCLEKILSSLMKRLRLCQLCFYSIYYLFYLIALAYLLHILFTYSSPNCFSCILILFICEYFLLFFNIFYLHSGSICFMFFFVSVILFSSVFVILPRRRLGEKVIKTIRRN